MTDHPTWVACPACSRNWPWASEQAVGIADHGKCLACILTGAVGPAKAREQEVGYRCIQCPTCIMTGDLQCPTCGGTRIAAEKLDGSELIDIRQPTA